MERRAFLRFSSALMAVPFSRAAVVTLSAGADRETLNAAVVGLGALTYVYAG